MEPVTSERADAVDLRDLARDKSAPHASHSAVPQSTALQSTVSPPPEFLDAAPVPLAALADRPHVPDTSVHPTPPGPATLIEEQRRLLRLLPPMPRPKWRAWLLETMSGTGLVYSICGFCVGLTHAFAKAFDKMGELPGDVRNVTVRVVWAEAVLVFLLHAYLVFWPSGVIRRCERTCLPLPTEVSSYLKRIAANSNAAAAKSSPHQATHDSGDYDSSPIAPRNLDGPDGTTFCVRCCVWRHAPRPTPQCGPALCHSKLPKCLQQEIDPDGVRCLHTRPSTTYSPPAMVRRWPALPDA